MMAFNHVGAQLRRQRSLALAMTYRPRLLLRTADDGGRKSDANCPNKEGLHDNNDFRNLEAGNGAICTTRNTGQIDASHVHPRNFFILSIAKSPFLENFHDNNSTVRDSEADRVSNASRALLLLSAVLYTSQRRSTVSTLILISQKVHSCTKATMCSDRQRDELGELTFSQPIQVKRCVVFARF
jgi:hypothetical protein